MLVLRLSLVLTQLWHLCRSGRQAQRCSIWSWPIRSHAFSHPIMWPCSKTRQGFQQFGHSKQFPGHFAAQCYSHQYMPTLQCTCVAHIHKQHAYVHTPISVLHAYLKKRRHALQTAVCCSTQVMCTPLMIAFIYCFRKNQHLAIEVAAHMPQLLRLCQTSRQSFDAPDLWPCIGLHSLLVLLK